MLSKMNPNPLSPAWLPPTRIDTANAMPGIDRVSQTGLTTPGLVDTLDPAGLLGVESLDSANVLGDMSQGWMAMFLPVLSSIWQMFSMLMGTYLGNSSALPVQDLLGQSQQEAPQAAPQTTPQNAPAPGFTNPSLPMQSPSAHNPGSSNIQNSQNSQTPSNSQPVAASANRPVNAALIEVDHYTNGVSGEHASDVRRIYDISDGGTAREITMIGLGNEQPENGNAYERPTFEINSTADLEEFIDTFVPEPLNYISQQISDIANQKYGEDTRVVNMSIGLSRNRMYQDVIQALAANPALLEDDPNLAETLGVDVQTVKSLPLDANGMVMLESMPPHVWTGVANYVDGRLADSPELNAAIENYQQATQAAAAKGVMVVVAAGNDHEATALESVHSGGAFYRVGAETNYLAMSDHVISVAASDDQNNADPTDDMMASFSSWGDGRHNPTIAADGVAVNGEEDINGTSFAAPTVAGVVTQMLEANPELSFEEVKTILQETAQDIAPSDLADGAGVMDGDAALQAAREQGQASEPDAPQSAETGETASVASESADSPSGQAVEATEACPAAGNSDTTTRDIEPERQAAA